MNAELMSTYFLFAVLAIAAIDDVATRRIHNVLLMGLALASLGFVFYLGGIQGLGQASLGFLIGFALYFPLAWMGILGGGDLKLLAVAGLIAGPSNIFAIGILGLIWGSIFGILQVVVNGQLGTLFNNLVSMAQFQKVQTTRLHKIPYAAALLLAGLTQWTLVRAGGFL